MIQIDGSKQEGGGAILRMATALSAITHQPCKVFNIRKGRKRPGLRPQHLLGLRALADLCNAELNGDQINSQQIEFKPGIIRAKPITIKIKTAGSITLALQGLIPVAIEASQPVEITFNGGATDTFFSPTLDHFRYVFLKILEKMNTQIKIDIIKRGYYPEGGAKLKAKIAAELKPIKLSHRGKLQNIVAISGAAEQLKNKKVAERQLAGVREVLGKVKLPVEEKVEYYQTQCPGSQICLIANFENTVIGTDNLGKLGKPAEKVGREAALELLNEQKSEACLDKHMADQILPYMALAGASEVTVSEITSHCKTNIWIIEKFLKGEFKIKKNHIKWKPN